MPVIMMIAIAYVANKEHLKMIENSRWLNKLGKKNSIKLNIYLQTRDSSWLLNLFFH